MISKYNHRHADHTVYTSEFGHVVQWDYKGYTISLASDGSTTAVWVGDQDFLFTTQGTGVASIVEAVKFVEDKA